MQRKSHSEGLSRRERRGLETRERLFRAALIRFAQKGFAETTVEDITEAADVGKGTFFNYFPSKDHILMAFGEMQIGKLEAFVGGIGDSDRPMLEMFRSLIARMTEEPIRNPSIVRALIQANLSSGPVRAGMTKLDQRNRELIGQLIRHGQKRGEIRDDVSAEELAQAYRQMIFGTLLFWSLIGDNSLPRRLESALGLLWAGIGRKETRESSVESR